MTGEQKYGMITISVYAYLSGVEKGAQNMKRRFLTPVLGGLLLLALAVIVVQQCYIQKGMPEGGVAGTYCTGEQVSASAEYYVFEQDGGYCRYRQNQMLERGSYVQTREEIYTLTCETAEPRELQVICREGRIYRCGLDGAIAVYDRFADVPVYLNVEPDASGQ